jgi:hypothetical protein
MKYLDLYNRLNLMKDKEYIENFLMYNSSLVIAGVKPAVTVNMKKNNKKLYMNWNIYGKVFIGNMNLKFIELRENENFMIIMIYDEGLLKKKLNKKSLIKFLADFGYPRKVEINEYINALKLRYIQYNCPPELGLFLGIPFKDVKDFMGCTSKKCLLCGYWKVYNNCRKAKKVFNKYDRVKEYTIDNILEGNSTYDIISNIKNSFYKVKLN